MAQYRTQKFRIAPPFEDFEITCHVCGVGIEEDKVTETERTTIQYASEGTVWNDLDVTKITGKVTVTIPAWTNCWFCGSNRFRSGGLRGDL